ncbi:hypothetical protein BK131_08395 [Paenibacillus amylolyticus]|uniref:Group-specific protein n=1 Tax=Paenibacillus amylolyticus TaxID=1451 RepID=A0A1R1C7F9_PAEAM|nr:hypothetical protein [Paenibacillus amylolyticus]OMF17948.1 hypothetical protein BK131_08395 [Paenibacillus amylolyticus]
MENVSQEEQLESIKAFQSTIRKSENALANMIQKSSNTTLLQKRLNALHIGAALLENVWNHEAEPHPYTNEEITEARLVLVGLFPSLESMYAKSKEGSPQKTLLERRIKAFHLAVQAMDTY